MSLSCAFAVAPSTAQITTSGAVFTWPELFTLGPGRTDIGQNGLSVGAGARGVLDVGGGSLLRAGTISIGPSAGPILAGNDNGSVSIRGVGTRAELTGDGFLDGPLSRLNVGTWGTGRLTVSGGAILDGTVSASACLGFGQSCHTFVANAAGSKAVFTVTGPGSQASFLRGFFVGGVGLLRPPVDSFTFGTPAGTSRGTVQVLDGAKLNPERATLGLTPGGGGATGRERSLADVLISGTNSVWTIKAVSLEANQASMYASNHANSWVSIRIENGGRLHFEAPATFFNGLRLTNNGGRSDMVVTGTGSTLDFNGGLLQVGRRLGTTTLDILEGGRLDRLYHMAVGQDGSIATMTIDGAGSAVAVNQRGNTGVNVSIGANNVNQLGRDRDLFPLEEIGVAQGSALSPLLFCKLFLDAFDLRMNPII